MKTVAACVLALGLSASLASPPAFAGSAPASLECGDKAPGSGYFRIAGTVPATEEDLKLVVGEGARHSTLAYDDVQIVSIDDFDARVYVLAVTDNRTHDQTVLHAIPSTMRMKTLRYGLDAHFDAKATGPKPGLGHPAASYDDFFHDVVLKCRYHYEV